LRPRADTHTHTARRARVPKGETETLRTLPLESARARNHR